MECRLHGLGVASATPFKADGAVDMPVLAKHIERLSERGADFIVALGTTAETPTLDPYERLAVSDTVLEHSKVPVVLGMGGNCTAALCKELRVNSDHVARFAAILSVCPYYNKPTAEGLYRHFAAVAEASPVPVILYNVPGRTGVNMTADTTLRLARDFPGQIVAVKEACGKLEQIEREIKEAPEGFTVLAGDDFIAFDTIALGGAGVVSVAGNVVPHIMSVLTRYAPKPEYHDYCRKINELLQPLDRLLFCDGNPAGIKCALSEWPDLGWGETMRLPLVPVTPKTRQEMAKVVAMLHDKEEEN